MAFLLDLYLADGTTPDTTGVFRFPVISPGHSDAAPLVRVLKQPEDATDALSFTVQVVDTGGDAEDWVTGTAEHLDSGGAVLDSQPFSKSAAASVTDLAPNESLRLTLHATVPGGAALNAVGNPFGIRLLKAD